jgi:dedicator of cytokinesis protein 3
MCEEKTFYTTDAIFPTVLRRSEVVDVQVVSISPLDNALVNVENKTRDLAALYVKYSALSKTTQVISTNTLSMALNSAVDTPHGGVPSYRQMFLSSEYIDRNPDRAAQIDKLGKAIDEHVSCLLLIHPTNVY